MMMVSVQQFNLLFAQVQNIVMIVQAIQATLMPPPVTQPQLVVPHVVSQLAVQLMSTLSPSILYPCPSTEAVPPSLEQLRVPPRDLERTTCHHWHPRSLGPMKQHSQSPRSRQDSITRHRSPQRSEAPIDYDLEIEQKLKKLDRQIEAIHNFSLTPNDGLNNDPSFDDKIMQVPLPRHFKIS